MFHMPSCDPLALPPDSTTSYGKVVVVPLLVGSGDVPSALNGTQTTLKPVALSRFHEPCSDTNAPLRHFSGRPPAGSVGRKKMISIGAVCACRKVTGRATLVALW